MLGTVINWIHSILTFFGMNPVPLAVFLAIFAALLGFSFTLRSQRRNLKNETNLSIYKEIRTDKRALASAITSFSAHVRGLGSEYLSLERIDSNQKLMGEITKKPRHEYEHDMRIDWGEYAKVNSDLFSKLSESFVNFHMTYEEIFFAIPKLDHAFKAIREAYQEWFKLSIELTQILYSYDAIDLLDKAKQVELQGKVDKLSIIEQSLTLQVYVDDFLKLCQKYLVGKLYPHKLKKRIPLDGSYILTEKGKVATKPPKNA